MHTNTALNATQRSWLANAHAFGHRHALRHVLGSLVATPPGQPVTPDVAAQLLQLLGLDPDAPLGAILEAIGELFSERQPSSDTVPGPTAFDAPGMHEIAEALGVVRRTSGCAHGYRGKNCVSGPNGCTCLGACR
jgi:hypothetical protein